MDHNEAFTRWKKIQKEILNREPQRDCPICGKEPISQSQNDYDWYQYTKKSNRWPSGEKYGTHHYHNTCSCGHHWCEMKNPLDGYINTKMEIIPIKEKD